MRHPAAVLGVCLFALLGPLAGCGDAAQRQQDLPVGRYDYSAVHDLPGSPDSVRLAGVMAVHPDNPGAFGIRWEVPDLNPDPLRGERVDGAFHVVAEPTYLGLIRHRLWVDPETGAIGCQGEYSIVLANGEEQMLPVTCRVTAGDAVTPELVPLVAPEQVDRPIDPDTLPPAHQPDPDPVRPR
jgi:hypothetical protein